MIYILIYLVGCVTSYLMGRKLGKLISFDNKWTKGDRVFFLFLSIFSWLTALVVGMYLLIMSDNDEEASW